MLNKELKLSKKIFKRDIEKVATRSGWGEGLVVAGENDENVVVLSADTKSSVRNSDFEERYPERSIQVGVAEQALATVAAGMATYGKIPFIATYTMFSPGRNWEQIRTTICLNDVPVKIGGAHAGLTVGPDGATHQALEDISLMRVLPNMIVVVPGDSIQTKKAVIEAATNGKPTYIRFAREETPVFTTEESPFTMGKAQVVWERKDPKVTIVACGPLVYEALRAAKELAESKIASIVINAHTIKPLDEQEIIKAAKLSGAVVTVEEHQVMGGLGGVVAETLSQKFPVPIEFVGMPDSFGESGTPNQLLSKYKMTKKDIVTAAKRVIRRKSRM